MRRSQSSSGLARLGLIGAALLFAFWQFPAVLGQRMPSFSAQAQQADKDLNGSYQQLLQKLPPSTREQLRKAQRAWLSFAELNKAAMSAAAQRHGALHSEFQRAEIEQVQTRTGELSAMLYPEDSGPDLAGRLRRADEELNVVYRRCIGTLTPAEVSKLREAQRAWVAFRDANQPFGMEICLRITGHRTTQLNDFYIRAGTSAVQATTTPEKPDSTVPDPFERAKK
jgi:uncharacterized protein YecT (DUF1311 family)